MSKYLISLTPVDKFFFGGEMTFPIEGKKDYNKKFSSSDPLIFHSKPHFSV